MSGCRVSGGGLGVLLLLAGGFVARPAQAYCRTRTCEFPSYGEPCELEPESGCSATGEYVYWGAACIPFAVQRDGSAEEGISAATVESIVMEGLQLWSDVPCSAGGSPELAAASQGPIACKAVEYDCKSPEANSNLIMFQDEFRDRDGFRLGVIALTTLTANFRTGELFDADIEINSRDEDFTLEGAGSLANDEPRDLRGVLNHELGHLLGLSHSRESGALMREAYEGTREPNADDIAGICAALGASDTDPACSTPRLGADAACLGADVSCRTPALTASEPEGCACHAAGAPLTMARGGWATSCMLMALTLLRRVSSSAARPR